MGSRDEAVPAELIDGRQSERALEIRRGTARLLRNLGMASLPEVTLANARRADLVSLSRNGDIWIIEIKSSIEDFRADEKWPDYLDYCDRFFFAVAIDFPLELLPENAGIVIADRYNAHLEREIERPRLPAARRKAVHLRFARTAGLRLQALEDPGSRAWSLKRLQD